MAEIKHARGVKLLIKIGNGASPEVFTQYCTVNADRGISFTTGTNDSPAIDCENPDQVSWVLREKTDLSSTINGSGTVNTPDVAEFFEFLADPEPRNCKVIVDVPSADGGVTWTGAYHLTEFSLTGNRGEKMTASVSFVSSGIVAIAPNAA